MREARLKREREIEDGAVGTVKGNCGAILAKHCPNAAERIGRVGRGIGGRALWGIYLFKELQRVPKPRHALLHFTPCSRSVVRVCRGRRVRFRVVGSRRAENRRVVQGQVARVLGFCRERRERNRQGSRRRGDRQGAAVRARPVGATAAARLPRCRTSRRARDRRDESRSHRKRGGRTGGRAREDRDRRHAAAGGTREHVCRGRPDRDGRGRGEGFYFHHRRRRRGRAAAQQQRRPHRAHARDDVAGGLEGAQQSDLSQRHLREQREGHGGRAGAADVAEASPHQGGVCLGDPRHARNHPGHPRERPDRQGEGGRLRHVSAGGGGEGF